MKKMLRDIKGLTILELIVVISVFGLIFSMSTYVFGGIFGRNALSHDGYQLVQDLREARTNAVSQKSDSSWGIYFDTSVFPHSYTLFKGDDYFSRDVIFDRRFVFPRTVSFYRASIPASHAIVFKQSDGFPVEPGYLILNSSEGGEYIISVNSFGLVEYDY